MKNLIRFLCFGFVFPFLGFCVEPIFRQAEVFYEAGQWEQARRSWEELLVRSPPLWERNQLFYNLGTLSLERGEESQALEYFKKVKNASSPLLKKRLQINIALALLQKAFHSSSTEAKLYFFYRALREIEAAEKSLCEFSHVIGQPECDISSIKELREKVLRNYHTLLKEMGRSVEDQIQILYSIQMIRQVLWQINPTYSAYDFLHNLLEEQQLSLSILMLSESISEGGSQFPIKAQTKVVDLARDFPEKVRESQKEEYLNHTLNEVPWVEVMNLFNEGLNFAQKSPLSIENEEEVMRYWQEALKKIKERKKEAMDTNFNQLLENIHTMDKEDQMKGKFENAPMRDEEIKPW